MSLTQFVWSLAGQESEVLDDLANEIAVEESDANVPDANKPQLDQDEINRVNIVSSDGSRPNDSGSVSSPKSFLGYLMGEPEVSANPVKPEDAPPSPKSFLGYFSSEAVPPPLLEEPKAEEAGFTSFLSHLAGLEEESGSSTPPNLEVVSNANEAKPIPSVVVPPSRLAEIADQLLSPERSRIAIEEKTEFPSYKVQEPSRSEEAIKFDNTDAEDLVIRLETGLPVRRSFLSSEVDAKMRLVEATSAMKKLQEIRNSSIRSAPFPEERTTPKEVILPVVSTIPPPAASRAATVFTEKQPVAPPVVRRPPVPRARDVPKRVRIVEQKRYLARPAWSSPREASNVKSDPGWTRHRAHHWFIPLGSPAPSDRIRSFPNASRPCLHADRQMPKTRMERSTCSVASVQLLIITSYVFLMYVNSWVASTTFGVATSLWSRKEPTEFLDEPPMSIGPDEEIEEVTRMVAQNTWLDFYLFLMGSNEETLGTEKPVEATLQQDPSFSNVMANIISSDSSRESSEGEDEKHEPKVSFPLN